jgi:type I restriction enzyme M protein
MELMSDSLQDASPQPFDNDVEPLGGLSNDQREIWKKILNLHQETAVRFTLANLEEQGKPELSENISLTLDLLERMGLIVPVTILDPDTLEVKIYYQRFSEKDKWQWQAES